MSSGTAHWRGSSLLLRWRQRQWRPELREPLLALAVIAWLALSLLRHEQRMALSVVLLPAGHKMVASSDGVQQHGAPNIHGPKCLLLLLLVAH